MFFSLVRIMQPQKFYTQLIRGLAMKMEQISERAYCSIGCGLLRRNVGDKMHPCRSTSVLTEHVSNVVDLRHYRNAGQLRSPDLSRPALRAAEKPRGSNYLWVDGEYRERMKVNAAVFVFLLFLITCGIWLLDGLSDAFGPERLARQHSHDVDAGTMVQFSNEIRRL